MPKLSLLNALAQAKLDADPNKNLMDWAKLFAVPNSAKCQEPNVTVDENLFGRIILQTFQCLLSG
jgi:hypothetical protein